MSPLDTFMFEWFGDTLAHVLLFNFVLVAPGAFASGHAVAITWRPWGQIVFYTALLSALLRFLDYALAERRTLVDRRLPARLGRATGGRGLCLAVDPGAPMVRQYPWLYRRKGLLGWEERH